MCEISVILPVYNNEKRMHQAVESILNQSFTDFEIILTISDFTDETMSMVRPFDDKRIRFTNESVSVKSTLGKYIAFMHTNYVMHPDRLKIQYALMEAEPSITVCTSWVKQTGNQKPTNDVMKEQSSVGLIENPLMVFLLGNCIIRPTAMIRKLFLSEQQIQHVDGDFKLWAEIAKHGGQFYVDTQTLMYGITPEKAHDEEQLRQSSEVVINEIVDFLAGTNKKNYPELTIVLENFRKLQSKEMMTHQDIVGFFHHFFAKNKDDLFHGQYKSQGNDNI